MKKMLLLQNPEGMKYFVFKFTMWMLLFSFSLPMSAQKVIPLDATKSATKLVENNLHNLQIRYAFDAIHPVTVKTEQGFFNELIMGNGYSLGELGYPKMPAINNLIAIPFGAQPIVNIKSFTVNEYVLADYDIEFPVMPMQSNLRKDQEVSEVPFEWNTQVYAKSSFAENELVEIEVLGVMRGMRIARITVAPVRYNPVEGTIKVYNNIDVSFTFDNADPELTNHISASTFSPFFEPLYARLLNIPSARSLFDDHPDLTKEPVKMLIVSHRDFEETLQPFIEWKTQTGIHVIEAYTDEIGNTSASIQEWIHGQYNAATPTDPAPTFVVIVGDPGKVPASAVGSSSNQVTDLYYASVDGDFFPEMYLGRLSARNVQELQNQLDKILYYQKYEFEDPTYLDDVTLIAGQDGFWNPNVGQPTVHYGTQNYFNAANGFNNVNTYLSSYTGCYDNDRISVSLINFTAHCSPTSWAGPYLTVTDIHNMSNQGKYPLAIGNCCQSALFSHQESVGEAWVRAANKGAVAYIGSAPNTHWFEDFYWAVGAFPISGNNSGYVPTVEETTMGAYDAAFISDYQALASIKFSGNLAITEANVQGYPVHVSNNSAQYYWQAYQTFGDPSTYIYKTQGSENEVSHMPILPIGLSTYTVNALPGSYVAVSKDGILHGAAFVGESGEVEVPIEPVLEGGDVLIVVTKSQYIPYMQSVPAAALEGPFVVLDEFIFSEEAMGFHYGQTASIDVTIKNVGADNSSEITGTLHVDDPYFTLISDDTIVFGAVNAGEPDNTVTVSEAFTFLVANDVPDQYHATFVLTLTDGDETWTSNLRLTANAPVLHFDNFLVEGTINAGVMDPGGVAEVIVSMANIGHAVSESVDIFIASKSQWLLLPKDPEQLDSIDIGEVRDVSFMVFAMNATPVESTAVLEFTAFSGAYVFAGHSEVAIGQSPTYSLGNIPTTYSSNVTTESVAIAPGEFTVTIPEGAVITGVDVSYSMTARNWGWISEQRSFLKCVSPGGTVEAAVTSGTENTEGTHHYNRTDLSIANNVAGGGDIAFELHAFRTWGGSGSSEEYNYVDDNSWKVVVHYLIDTYSIVFDVTDPHGQPIDDAVIELFGFSFPEGMHAFDNIAAGIYEYSISRPDFEPHTGLIEVDEEDIVVEIQLAPIPRYQVSFSVTDWQDQLVEDAVVTINEHVHQAGVYTISELLAGTYEYEVTKDGYIPATGSFDIVDDHIGLDIILMVPLMSVEFVVKDEEHNPIEEATIAIEGQIQEAGQYFIAQLPAGVYGYEVSYEGYFTQSGSFELSDHDLEVLVTLSIDNTFVRFPKESTIKIFPNPFQEQLTIQPGNQQLTKVQIVDLLGNIIYSQSDVSHSQTLNLDYLPSGNYFVRIITTDKTQVFKVTRVK